MKRFLLICLFCFPVGIWIFYKPTRVLAPELAGVTCAGDIICTDDMSRYEEAVGLYDEAYEFVNSTIGAIEKRPRVIFCTTEACFQSFGFNKRAAGTVGNSGIVISPRGWKDYYIRHEFIHHLQAERMGVLGQLFSPKWFTEGMGYSLSQDPGHTSMKSFSNTGKNSRNGTSQWVKSVCGKRR